MLSYRGFPFHIMPCAFDHAALSAYKLGNIDPQGPLQALSPIVSVPCFLPNETLVFLFLCFYYKFMQTSKIEADFFYFPLCIYLLS